MCSVVRLMVLGLVLWTGYGEAAGKLTMINPTEGTVGTTITIMGEGYGPTETVRVDFGGRLDVAKVTTTEEGTFTAEFQLTPHPAGQAKFACVGYKTLSYNEGFISIKGRLIGVTPENGRPGTELRITGDGYASSEDIQVSFGDNENILTGKANGMGAFDLVFTVDRQPAGKRIITVQGLNSKCSNNASFEITGGITSVEPGAGPVGTKIAISGAGFGAGEKVKIDLGNISNIAEVTSSKQGEWTASFAVLSQAAGAKTIMATGLKSHQIGMDRFVVSPVITLISPIEGFVGTKVRIEGNGFASSESIRVDLNRSMGIGRGEADEMGRLVIEFMVDAQPSDKSCRIGIIGRESRRPCYIDTFKILSRIDKIETSFGTVGVKVHVSGSGYNAGELVKIDFGKSISINIVSTDQRGVVSIGFTVDAQSGGKKAVVISGLTSGKVNKGEFEITPSVMRLTPENGCVGDSIEIGGNGYGADEVIQIDMGEIKSVSVVQSDKDGQFLSSLIIPDQTGSREKVLRVWGLSSNMGSLRKFEVKQALLISPANGTKGTIVSVNGTGFGADEIIRVDCGNSLGIASGKSDAKGNFSASFEWTAQEIGDVRVVGIGLTNFGIGTAIFKVEEIKKEETATEEKTEKGTAGLEK
ncbi:hypothetical protein HY792_03240 [Candidatus Desantisbacteria bacterium]|nr:hypothetical protein [Candidatus Desantisbacteria bacterium]